MTTPPPYPPPPPDGLGDALEILGIILAVTMPLGILWFGFST